MLGLYKFYEDYFYGELLGFFVADRKDINNIKGSVINMGDCLGKYSDVEVELDDSNITLISEDSEYIQWAENNGIISGYNPLKYIEDDCFEKDEDEDDEEYDF